MNGNTHRCCEEHNEAIVTQLNCNFYEAHWKCSVPRRALPVPTLERIIHSILPHHGVLDIQPLAGGLRNANFKVYLSSAPELVVLRIYEHDRSICQKEIDLLRRVGNSVPVPEVIHAEPCGLEEIPPFMLMRYVEGIIFLELKRSGDTEAIAQAAFSAGEVLSKIGHITFSKAGWLGPGPEVSGPLLEGANVIPRFFDLCLASVNLQERVPADLRNRTHAFVWSWAAQLAMLEHEAYLVHGDFNRRNLLMQRIAGRWSVAAVLDWELAVSGSPLGDLGNFLRYERAARPIIEPHFSAGYLHGGGTLPENWRYLARLIDLTALYESLTHDQLPDTMAVELVELIRATVKNRDP